MTNIKLYVYIPHRKVEIVSTRARFINLFSRLHTNVPTDQRSPTGVPLDNLGGPLKNLNFICDIILFTFQRARVV